MKHTSPKMNRLLAGVDSSTKTANEYRRMLALARELGLEFEIERMAEMVNEYEADADDQRDQLLALGYEPE